MTRIRDEDHMEQEGLNHLSEQVRQMRHVWRPTSSRDVGIDGEIELFDEGGHATGKIIKVQSKAGRSYIRNEKPGRFDYYADANHIGYWARVVNPVIIVIYDPDVRLCYWVDFKKYLQTHPEVQQSPHKITFDKSRQLTADKPDALNSIFGEDDVEAESDYRQHIVDKHGKLTLYSVASDKPLAVDLERVFVKLTAIERRRQHSPELLRPSQENVRPENHSPSSPAGVSAALKRTMEEVTVTLSPGEALRNHNQLIVLGAPGAGKTTLLKYLALTFSRGLTEERLSINEARTPILIALRDFSRYLDKLAACKELCDLGPQLVSRFLQEHFINTAPHLNLPIGFFERILRRGHCIVLLDGFDEVSDPLKRARVAEEIVVITQFYRNNRFIITSRPRGYEGEAKQRLSQLYSDCTIRDFENDEMEAFAKSWYEAVTIERLAETEDSRAEARRQAKDLLRAIHADVRVRRLASNPLLLSVLAMVHQRGVGLPQRRAELYEECTEMLFGYWDQTKGGESARDLAQLGDLDRKEKRMLLEPVALWFHERGEKGSEADRADLVTVIARQFRENGDHERQARRRAEGFIDLIEQRAGLLVEREPSVFAFAHLTFQEYLAARAISDREDYIEYSLAKLHDPWWREVLLLEVAHLTSSHNLGRRARKLTSELISAILGAKSWLEDVLRRDLFFAARCVCDTGKLGVDETLRRNVIDQLLHILFKTPYAKQRDQITELLIYALPTPEGEHIKAALIEQSQNYDVGIRRSATKALAGIFAVAFSTEVFRALIKLRQDSEFEISSIVRSALRTVDPAAENTLLQLIDDADPTLRAEATRILAQSLTSRTARPDPAIFMPLIQDASPQVRVAAVQALVLAMHKGSRPERLRMASAILSLIHDPNQAVRHSVLRATGFFKRGEISRELRPALTAMIEVADRNQRRVSTSHEVEIDYFYDVELSNVMINYAFHGSGNAGRIADTGNPSRWVDLTPRRLQEPGSKASPGLVQREEILVDIAASKYHLSLDPSTRLKAAKAIGALGPGSIPPECLDILDMLLRDSVSEVRRAGVNALGCLGPLAISQRTISALASLLRDSDPNVCFSAANALTDLGPAALSKETLDALVALLGDFPTYVRGAALIAFRRMVAHSVDVRNSLSPLLNSPDSNIREGAIRALGNAGFSTASRDMLSTLCSLLGDTSSNVRDSAAMTLEKIGGEDLTPGIRERLEAFWQTHLNNNEYSQIFEEKASEAAYEALQRLSIHHERDRRTARGR